MARFDSAIALAHRLITKNGHANILRSVGTGTPPDPTKPWETGANPITDHSVMMVFLNYERKYVDGTRVRMGDQIVYMPNSDLDGTLVSPDEDDQIIRGAEVWQIIEANPLNPNGQSIFFELQVRR